MLLGTFVPKGFMIFVCLLTPDPNNSYPFFSVMMALKRFLFTANESPVVGYRYRLLFYSFSSSFVFFLVSARRVKMSTLWTWYISRAYVESAGITLRIGIHEPYTIFPSPLYNFRSDGHEGVSRRTTRSYSVYFGSSRQTPYTPENPKSYNHL